MAGGKRGHQSDNTKAEDKKPKVDDKAYQEALKRIPDSKEKYDPWAVTKTPDADKSSKNQRRNHTRGEIIRADRIADPSLARPARAAG